MDDAHIPDGAALAARLSPREREVWRCVSLGMTNYDIKDHLALSHHTVRNYVTALLDTLRLESRTQLAIVGVMAGLVSAADIEAMWAIRRRCYAYWPRKDAPGSLPAWSRCPYPSAAPGGVPGAGADRPGPGSPGVPGAPPPRHG